MNTILLNILIILVISALPTWPYRALRQTADNRQKRRKGLTNPESRRVPLREEPMLGGMDSGADREKCATGYREGGSWPNAPTSHATSVGANSATRRSKSQRFWLPRDSLLASQTNPPQWRQL
jgi:hypothetical protein